MKKSLITLALAGSFALGMTALPLFAQDAPPPPPPPMQQGMNGMHHGGMHHGRMSPDRQLQHLTQALNLSADQQAQIKPILVERDHTMHTIWQNQSLTPAQRRDQMMAAMHQSNTKLEAVFTPDQKQKYEAMMQRRMERMHNWQHGHNGPQQSMNGMPPGMHRGMHPGMHHRGMNPAWQLSRLTQALNLSTDQQAKLKSILIAQNQKIRSIWQQQMQERQQAHEQIMAAVQTSNTQLEAALTPDQNQKLEAMMLLRMERMHNWQHNHGAPTPQPQQ